MVPQTDVYSHNGWDSFVGLRVENVPCCTPRTDVLVGSHMSSDDFILPTAWPLLFCSFFLPPPLMSSGYGWCGVQIFSFTATFQAGHSHGAPNASLEYWMNLRTTSMLPDQQRYRYLAIALQVVSCSVRMDGLWIFRVVVAGTNSRCGWVFEVCLMLSHVLVKPLLSVFLAAKVASKLPNPLSSKITL